MVRCGRPAVFMWSCDLHTIEYYVLCHTTVVVIYSKVCSLYTPSTVYFRYCCAPHNTSSRTAVGRLATLCTYLQPWRETARGLRSFRACTTTRMKLAGGNVPCKQCCAGVFQELLYHARYKGYINVLGTQPHLPGRATPERVPPD